MLFKTSLLHIRKNATIVSVLGFFLSLSVTVLTSVDHLSDNLNKGFKEIEFDSNSHDLILVNKSFKQTQNLNVKPSYSIDLSNIKFGPKRGFRWSFDSNFDYSWVKKGNKDKLEKLQSSSDQPQPQPQPQPQTQSSSDGPKVEKLNKSVFTIPVLDETERRKNAANEFLICRTASNFILTLGKEIQFIDRNKASLRWGQYNGDDVFDNDDNGEINVLSRCGGESEEKLKPTYFAPYFYALQSYFTTNIIEDKDVKDGTTTTTTTTTTSEKQPHTLDKEELYELHEKKAFNPKYLFRSRLHKKRNTTSSETTEDIYSFRPIFERDYYLDFFVPFKNILGTQDISKKYKQLVQEIKNVPIYYKLDFDTKQSIEIFSNSRVFDRIPVKFYISSLQKLLETFDAWLPMVPGLSYSESLILLIKLLFWESIKDAKVDNFNTRPDHTLQLKDIFDKKKIKGLVDQTSTSSIKDIESFQPFHLNENEYKSPHTGSYSENASSLDDYLFSTVRANKTLKDLKDNEKEYQKYKDQSQSGGSASNASTWCGSSSSSSSSDCSNFKFSDSDTVAAQWKKAMKAWMEGKFFSEETSTSSTGDFLFLPSYTRTSKEKYDAAKNAKDSNNPKPFDDTGGVNPYYRLYPEKFEVVFDRLKDAIFATIKDYLLWVELSNLREVKKFINDYNLFTLSFLLYNFQYKPKLANLDTKDKLRLSKVSFSKNQKQADLDFSISSNYHKSLVVANSSNTSAKLNDPTKKNHAFKIITQEVKDDSSLNRLKIVTGNPLFEAKYRNSEIIKRINTRNNTIRKYSPTYEYAEIFKLLSRAKYTNPEYAPLFKDLYTYYSSKTPETWKLGVFFSYLDLERALVYTEQLSKYARNLKTQGSRTILEFTNWDDIYFARTMPLKNTILTLKTTGYLDQFTSVFGLISPFYAKKHNIVPISNEQYQKFKKLIEDDSLTQEEWEKEYHGFLLNPKNHDHIVNINGNKIIVLGTALSPDFLLPSHSFLNLIPDKNREALIYMDEHGYRNIHYNSLSSWNEYYLSLSYPQAVKDYGLEKDYYQELRKYMDGFLSDSTELQLAQPSSAFELRKVSDSPDRPSLVHLRSNYVDNFVSVVNLVAYVLLSFIGVIIFFTVWTLIKKYINSSLNTFGVFVASGVPRLEIITTSFSFIFIPALIGTFVGYIASLLLQPFVFSLLSDVWYLTPVFSGFDLSKFLNYSFLMCGILFPVALIPAFKMLRPSAGYLMRTNSMFKQNSFTVYIHELFQKVSSVWKFRLSVILNTLNKGIILSAATAFLFLFSSFLFNNLGQFANVSQLELISKNYGFELDLDTPSEQSGQYFLSSYRNLGNTFLNKIPQTKRIVQRKNSSGNEYEAKVVTFDKNNPEMIATGVFHPFHPNDLSSYLNSCKDKDIVDIYKELGVLDTEYPSRLFSTNAYNIYLLKSSLSKKSQDSQGCFNLENEYEAESFAFRNTTHASAQIWYSSSSSSSSSSSGDNSQQPKFNPNPNPTNDNFKDFQLSDYVPVKNEAWKSNGSGGSSGGSSTQAPEMIKFGDEPLFKPLIDYYKNKQTLTDHHDSSDSKSWYFNKVKQKQDSAKDSTTSTTSTVTGDFRTFNGNGNGNGNASGSGGNDNKFPTLSRLFKDNSNYWLFSYGDIEAIQNDPVFFKNKVIIPFLFNHDWKFNLFGKTIEINPWNEFNDYFSKYSPELTEAMSKNYLNFVNKIINSRYGYFFVNRFMTKHVNVDDNMSLLPGSFVNGKRSWKVDKSSMAKPSTSTSTSTSTNDEANDVDTGIYYLDPDKLIYFYDKLVSEDNSDSAGTQQASNDLKHLDRFVIFRPDFLYLFFALMSDPEFLTPETAPIKITFHQNLYSPDYNTQYTDEWQISGDREADEKLQKGLTASYSSMKDEDYSKIPNGDQTYTYLLGDVGPLQNLKIYGLKQDSRGSYFNLTKDGASINKKLYQQKQGDVYPIVINQYTAKKLGLTVGSQFSYHVRNTYDRFTKALKGDNSKKQVKFKVVDIFDSYYQTALFISQAHANEIIGLNEDYGFNGILTKKFLESDQLPIQLTHGVSGFAPSGLYSRHVINKNGDKFKTFLNSKGYEHSQALQSKFIQPTNLEWFKLKNGLELTSGINNAHDLASKLEDVYGQNFTLTPSIVKIDNMSVFNDFVFNTASDLVLSVINLFIVVLSPLLICSLLVITVLIIEDLKNLLTILNLLGFSYFENSVTILLYLGLILGFSTMVAIPVTSSLLGLYVEKVFNVISIYLPISLRADFGMASFSILLGIFSFAYLRSMGKIKSLYLPLAMKSLNE